MSSKYPPPLAAPLVADERDRRVLLEHRRVVRDGRVVSATTRTLGAPSTVSIDVAIDEAVGLTEPAADSVFAYRLDVMEGEASEGPEAELESVWQVVEIRRARLSPDERVRELEADRGIIIEQATTVAGDLYPSAGVDAGRSLDEELFAISEGREDPGPPVVVPADLETLGREADGPVRFDLCGPRLPPALIPRHLLRLDLKEDTTSDREALVERLRAERAARVGEVNAELAALVESVGGRVQWQSDRDDCISGEVPTHGAFLALATADVRRVSIVRQTGGSAEVELDGDFLRDALQLEQFRLANINGETPSSRPGGFGDLTVGIVDEGFEDAHVGWNDTATGSSRLHGRWRCEDNAFECQGGTCYSESNLPWQTGFSGYGTEPVDHGTTIASIIAADFTQGQEASLALVPTAERGQYSGYATEAGLVLLQGEDGSCANRAAAINRGVDVNVDVMSMSVCRGNPTITCGGSEMTCTTDSCSCDGAETRLVDEVNQAFKDGVPVLKAAGNNGATASCCECTISSPGDAEGAITVGGTGDSNDNDRTTASLVPTSSSRGLRELRKNGGAREGTVTAIAAPRCRRKTAACELDTINAPLFCYNPPCPCNIGDAHVYETAPECGTSYATPTVAAAALLQKDRWIQFATPTNWLDQAELLKLYVMVMGDRTSGDTVAGVTPRGSVGFSQNYGAGRLRPRMFTSEGMDSPWRNSSTWFTLSDGEVETRWISADGTAIPLSTDVERVKVVAWWYEPRTEISDTTPAAHITMRVRRFTGANCGGTPTTVATDATYDTRKMLFLNLTPVANACYRVELVGTDVTANPEASNALTRRVNLAVVYEDNDRDDADGPVGCDANFAPAGCVEPL